MTKYPQGSQGAAEAKSNTIMLIVLAVITLIVGCVIFFGNNDLNKFAHRAGLVPNILGITCFVGSWIWLYLGVKNEWSGKAIIGWIILLVLGFTVSCGFNFDYFGIK